MKKTLSAFGAFACVGVSLAAAFTDPSAWRLSRFAKIAGDRLVVDVPADRAAEGGSGRIDVDLSPFRDRAVEAIEDAAASGRPHPEWLVRRARAAIDALEATAERKG